MRFSQEKLRVASATLFWTLLTLFLISPIIGIILLSLKWNLKGGTSDLSFSCYEELFNREKFQKILQTVEFSLLTAGSSSTIAMAVALCSMYTMRSPSTVWPRPAQIVTMTLGLAFLPAFTLIAPVDASGITLNGGSAIIAIIFAQVIAAYSLAFVILWIVFGSMGASYPQLLIEKRSQLGAFIETYILRNRTGILLTAALAFTQAWGEYHISFIATLNEEVKPFPVLLQGFNEQQQIRHCEFAIGALLSLALTLLPVLILWIVWRIVQWVLRGSLDLQSRRNQKGAT